MTNRQTDVLVVGAGPTGLSLAAQLSSFGIAPRVVDRGRDRVRESRALAIQPRTLEVLAGLGIAGEVVERGNPAVQLRIHARGRERIVQLFDLGLDDTAYPYLLFLSQAETERILEQHLAAAGVTVERGTELIDLSDNSDGVAATLRHSDGTDEVIHAGYVVGCDGAHSTVRRAAGIEFEGSAYPQTFVLADLEADGLEPGAAHVFLSRNGMLFFFPLGAPATWRMLAMRPRSDEAGTEASVTLEEVQSLADAYTEAQVRLADPVWMTNFRLHHRGATRYRTGRVFLAGDAAHIHSPAGGQGMNTGIQDATNIGWKLASTVRGLGDPMLLDTYEPERAPIGRAVLRFTDRAFTIATSTNPIVRLGRTRLAPAIIPLALKASAGRAYLFRTVSQLAIRYRRSPLSLEGPAGPRRGPRAGDRLPDAPILHDGLRSTLHAAIAAPGWHLFLCGPTDAWPAEGVAVLTRRHGVLLTVHRLTVQNGSGDVRDPDGRALHRLGLGPADRAQYVVRPDGYIGYRAGGTDLTGLARYLGRWLTAPRPGDTA